MTYIIAAISGAQTILKKNFWYDINHIKRKIGQNLLTLEKILLVRNNSHVQIGQPFLKNCFITGLILCDVFGKKIKILKTKPKKNYTRLKGYKHKYTRIFI
jgi:large subunit ribosomal protein L21